MFESGSVYLTLYSFRHFQWGHKPSPVLVSPSRPVVQVSFSVLEVIMNSVKQEKDQSFGAAADEPRTRPEGPEVRVQFTALAGTAL